MKWWLIIAISRICWQLVVYETKQLLNDFKVYLEKYFAQICNINLAAYTRSVDIANSRKIFFNVYLEIIQ